MDWRDIDECKDGGDGALLVASGHGNGDSANSSPQPHHGQIADMTTFANVRSVETCTNRCSCGPRISVFRCPVCLCMSSSTIGLHRQTRLRALWSSTQYGEAYTPVWHWTKVQTWMQAHNPTVDRSNKPTFHCCNDTCEATI